MFYLLERKVAVQRLTHVCADAVTTCWPLAAAGPPTICATRLRPPYVNLNSLSVPPTMGRLASDCEHNLKETMSLLNELQGRE